MQENENLPLETSEEAKDNNWEQPEDSNTSHTANAELNVKNDGESNATLGSPLGKFKNAESLIEAYNSLQKEFTKKSQKLSETTKELQDIKENATKVVAPLIEAEDWSEKVNNFLATNPSAKEYVDQISELILSDKTLATASEPLDLAWAKILSKKFSNPAKLVEEEEFLKKYILNNEKITDQIIQNYLSSLRGFKAVPVISNHSGSSFSLAPKNKPNNLDEAKKLAEALFKI